MVVLRNEKYVITLVFFNILLYQGSTTSISCNGRSVRPAYVGRSSVIEANYFHFPVLRIEILVPSIHHHFSALVRTV